MNNDFEHWWETSGRYWADTRVERGGTPWTADICERRELFNRRNTRPRPPQGLYTELADIRGTAA